MKATATVSGAGYYVDGAWRTPPEWREVQSPFDGSTVDEFAWCGVKEAQRAIDAAARAMQKPMPAHQRARILGRAAELLRERKEMASHTIALEAGKPITAALAEVDRAEQTLLFSEAAARGLTGEMIPMDAHPAGEGRLGLLMRFPIGVVAAITPFNFPLNLAAHKIGPALAAGCACVLKPADRTPFSGLLLTQIFEDAGLPAGWLNTVTGDPVEISDVFLEDERVKAISFTGSAQVGWDLRARAPRKKVMLELGNSTPLIVMADANLDAAATAIVSNGYLFSGQACISIQRVLVERAAYPALVDKLVPAIARLRTGDPLDLATQIGPVISQASCNRILEWVLLAERAGATLLTGEVQVEELVLRPMLLGNVDDSMAVSSKKIFGPVVTIEMVTNLKESVQKANNTHYGLQAGIFTADFASALGAVAELDFGGVTINESPSFRSDHMPYGGNKDSGNTREGPAYVVHEFSQYRTVNLPLYELTGAQYPAMQGVSGWQTDRSLSMLGPRRASVSRAIYAVTSAPAAPSCW